LQSISGRESGADPPEDDCQGDGSAPALYCAARK
ncbi:hypothetical protein T4A_2778, partial [Trichinella pseudospiralis]